MNNKKNYWGFFFIIIGVLLLISKIFNIQLFSMHRLWPIFVLILGLSFEVTFFSTRTKPGLLVPGGILTTLGFLFLFENMTNWHFAGHTWPIYPLAVAIGLGELYIFGDRRRELLIPVVVLCLVSGISFMSMLFGDVYKWINYSLLLPAILVIIGLVLIFGKGHQNKQ